MQILENKRKSVVKTDLIDNDPEDYFKIIDQEIDKFSKTNLLEKSSILIKSKAVNSPFKSQSSTSKDNFSFNSQISTPSPNKKFQKDQKTFVSEAGEMVYFSK